MAETKITVRADVSDAVKGFKGLIKILRTANQELKKMESFTGTGNTINIIVQGSR